MSNTVGATVRPVANDVPVTPMLTNPVLRVATSALEAGRPLQLVLPPGLDGGLPAVADRVVAGDLRRERDGGPGARAGVRAERQHHENEGETETDRRERATDRSTQQSGGAAHRLHQNTDLSVGATAIQSAAFYVLAC